MALSGVRSSWLMVARKRDLAMVGFLGAAPRLVGDRLLLLDLGDQRVLLGAELEHGGAVALRPLQEDEIDVQADRHGRHRQIEGVIEQREAHDDRRSHRQCAGIDDRHDWACEQYAHRDDDEKCGKDESVCCLAGATGADKGDAAQDSP